MTVKMTFMMKLQTYLNIYVSSWRDKGVMKWNTWDEQKRRKGSPLHLANISLTEKPEKTLKNYFELHIQITVLNILMEQIELFLCWMQNLCLSQTWINIAVAKKHFNAQSGKSQLCNTFDKKQKLTKSPEAAWT